MRVTEGDMLEFTQLIYSSSGWLEYLIALTVSSVQIFYWESDCNSSDVLFDG